MGTPAAVLPTPRLLNVRAAAAYLGCTIWFVRTLGWNDTVRVLKMGNRWLFDKSDLDAYVERLKKS